MKLSEAIRLGAMLRPKAVGAVLQAETGATCAVGAALDAIGRLSAGLDEAVREWPILLAYERVVHPLFGDSESDVLDVILDLNDTRHWTREAIADWVATIEEKHTCDLKSCVPTVSGGRGASPGASTAVDSSRPLVPCNQ